MKDDLELLKEKCKSVNNTILINPVPRQINDTTPPTYTDNECVERANNIIVFNLPEQSN